MESYPNKGHRNLYYICFFYFIGLLDFKLLLYRSVLFYFRLFASVLLSKI